MKKTIVLLLLIPCFIVANNRNFNTNKEIPKFVNKKVIQSLNYKAEGKIINNYLTATKNQEVLMQLAKLNALHQYYTNLWEENNSYTLLPQFLERMLAIDKEIRNNAGTYKDADLFFLTPRKYPQYFGNNNVNYNKTLQQIETEVENWLHQFDTPKSIQAITSIFNVGEVKADVTLADKICSLGYSNWASSVPVKGFEDDILTFIGVPTDTPDREKHISKFFNENNDMLICGDDNDLAEREKEHILKRSIALSEYDFLLHAANSSKYELDWNFYEVVDGKKETILDYLDMIINDEELALEYDVDELKSLARLIGQLGGKRGKDL